MYAKVLESLLGIAYLEQKDARVYVSLDSGFMQGCIMPIVLCVWIRVG